jgi:hypothetical protein
LNAACLEAETCDGTDTWWGETYNAYEDFYDYGSFEIYAMSGYTYYWDYVRDLNALIAPALFLFFYYERNTTTHTLMRSLHPLPPTPPTYTPTPLAHNKLQCDDDDSNYLTEDYEDCDEDANEMAVYFELDDCATTCAQQDRYCWLDTDDGSYTGSESIVCQGMACSGFGSVGGDCGAYTDEPACMGTWGMQYNM